MTCSSHPHYGSLVGVCTSSSDIERLSLHTSFECNGIQALQKISRLSSELYDRVQTKLGGQIDIPTLRAALLLARDPKTISHLADPPVLKACVRLMKTVQGLSPTGITPFSHEYGFLCFRLFVAVFNVCFLKRWDKLEEILPLCDRDPELAAHTFTSWMTAWAVGKLSDIFKAGGDCDWIFAWFAPANLLQPALLPLSDVSILFDLIWNDRKQFLLSHIPFTPESTGLSGLMFMFSRYVAQERSTNKKQLQHKLYEIALRYALIADPGQRRATIDVIDANKCTDDWFVTPKHIDADDSRFILCAYVRTMTLYKDVYTTLHPPVMLRLVALSVDDSSQELLPEVVLWTIEYGWRRFLSLDDEEDNFEMFIHLFVSSLSFLLLPPLEHDLRLIPSTQFKIIDIMLKKGLLDWVARALIRLRPPSSLAELEENGDVLKGIIFFIKTITKVFPPRELERCFRQYVPDWWKVHRLFATMPAGLSSLRREHYEHCAHTWVAVAEEFGLEPAIDEYAGTHCYDGEVDRGSGARFGCTGCIHAWYCDDLCKRMDWRLVHPHSHHTHWHGPNMTVLLPSYACGI